MNRSMQLWGLVALTILAALLLILVGITFFIIGSHITPDGNVPAAEAFGLTALLLSFREVIGSIRALYDHEDRANLTDKLASSTPNETPPPPATATDAASQVANAAQERADEITGEKA